MCMADFYIITEGILGVKKKSTGTNKIVKNALYSKTQRLIAETHRDTERRTQTHKETQTHKHRHTHIDTQVHTHPRINTHIHTHTYIPTHKYTHPHTHTHMGIS